MGERGRSVSAATGEVGKLRGDEFVKSNLSCQMSLALEERLSRDITWKLQFITIIFTVYYSVHCCLLYTATDILTDTQIKETE